MNQTSTGPRSACDIPATDRREPAVACCVGDQCLVGDKTFAFNLMDGAMYECMSKTPPVGHESEWHVHPAVERGVALHKIARLLTLSPGTWMAFMGNEFGHPEWVDFPREGNGFSFQHARRQWSLRANTNLFYSDLERFDGALMRCDDGARVPVRRADLGTKSRPREGRHRRARVSLRSELDRRQSAPHRVLPVLQSRFGVRGDVRARPRHRRGRHSNVLLCVLDKETRASTDGSVRVRRPLLSVFAWALRAGASRSSRSGTPEPDDGACPATTSSTGTTTTTRGGGESATPWRLRSRTASTVPRPRATCARGWWLGGTYADEGCTLGTLEHSNTMRRVRKIPPFRTSRGDR